MGISPGLQLPTGNEVSIKMCMYNKQAKITQTHKNVSCRSQGLLILISGSVTGLFLGFSDFTASCLGPVTSIILSYCVPCCNFGKCTAALCLSTTHYQWIY